ncbi:hypothetical protein CVT25_000283 [Psilocybe cyanescens]|uniref:CCHC-type domain-containing protein n=1 Tax=Psilocybe cyanescens TaxID=93625 RepID=A0A409X8U3_PSICY|nr:hypothetical protein CVT25_000283 [Psilocybe cyanescens]
MSQPKSPPDPAAKTKPPTRILTRQDREKQEKETATTRRCILDTPGSESPPPPSTQFHNDGKDKPINNMTDAREYLESTLMYVPRGAPPTPHNMATALFQVAEMKGLTQPAVRAVRSVAYMMERLETDTTAAQAREVAVEQAEYVREELRNMASHITTTISAEVEKHLATITETTQTAQKALTQYIPQATRQPAAPSTTRYSDAVRSQDGPVRHQTDPRLMAREGIRMRQFLLDFPSDSLVHKISQTELLRLYNAGIAALDDDTTGKVKHKIRSVERLSNKGILGEFLTDDGAKWFHTANNADRLFSSLGESGEGAQRKARTYNLIAYYVPVEFETDNRKHIDEMLETNNLHIDDLERVRWAKPIARRNKERRQNYAHLILAMRNIKKANKVVCDGLVIHGKRVDVRKSKKEPIRCLKCQGYNHIARECINDYDTCGNCANRTHKTENCTSQSKKCVACGDQGEGHTSWDRNCPTFHRKCQQFDANHPENAIPFFPDTEPWTWTAEYQPPTIRHKQVYEPTTQDIERRAKRVDDELRPMRQSLLDYRPQAKTTTQPTPHTKVPTTHQLPERPTAPEAPEKVMTREELTRLEALLASEVEKIVRQETEEKEKETRNRSVSRESTIPPTPEGTPPPNHDA